MSAQHNWQSDTWTLADGTVVKVLYSVWVNGHPRASYDILEAIMWHSAFPEHSIAATMVKVR